MNLFSLAMRYLRVQKRRTILTAIGVTLAVALVSGTGILLASFLQMRLTQSIRESGSWHYAVNGLESRALADRLKSNVLFQKAGLAAGDTALQVSEKDGKSETIPLLEYDATAFAMMPNALTQGRAPKNDGEIMLSTTAASLFPGVKLGDSLSFPCGTLALDGESGSSGGSAGTIFTEQNTGTFTGRSTRTFAVVGFFRRGLYDYENIESAVTLNPSGAHAYSVYAQIKPGLDFPASIRKTAAGCGISREKIQENGVVEWMGKSASTRVRTAVVTTFLILAAIILAITMLVIRNSFAMSVADKTREIGTLRCLGAAPGHIRGLVLSEALGIWGMAVPAGLLAGAGAIAGVIAAVKSLDPDDFQFITVAPAAWPYLLAAALSFLTVLLSSFGPVRITMRVPMVEAVRGNAVYRESRIRRNRKGRLLGRLLGFSGLLAAKNIRRSPRRFRTTVLSVVASVILFITVGGFAADVGVSLQTAMRQSGKMDYEFSANRELADTVQAFHDIEQKVRGMSGAASVQRTPVYAMNLSVPAGRVPPGYRKTYREFRSADEKKTASGAITQQLLMLEVSRENYATLRFEGKAPSYDELAKSGGALLCQVSSLFSSSGRFASAAFADYHSGETLSVTQTVSPAKEEKEITQTFDVKIAGLLSELPWFTPQQPDGVLVFPEEGTARFDTAAVRKAAREKETGDSCLYLAIRYAKGAEAQTDAQIRKLMGTAYKTGLGFSDNYHDTVGIRNNYLIMLIFVGGFAAVVILISCINLFNTIHANLQTRKREIAMTRAIGMDRSHLIRMLLLECSLYGIIGTIWGIVIGLPLQYLLLKTFHFVFAASLRAPLLMALFALAATSGIGIVAGLSSIRRIVQAPIVEEIRAQE